MCGSNSQPKERKLVQISVVKRREVANSGKATETKLPIIDKTKTRLVPAVETFHCGECLLTLANRTSDYYHRCKGYNPATADDPRREYQRQRQAKCDVCQHNVDGVCAIEKSVHPDRPCLIELGVRKHWARCRIGEWDGIN